MKGLMILPIVLPMGNFASAQSAACEDLKSEIRRLGNIVNNNLPSQYRASLQTSVARLEAISREICSGGMGVGPLLPPRAEYTCVSRDNDGQSPYVFAIRQGIDVLRIRTEQFRSMQDCTQSLNSVRYEYGRALLCVSRDSDGQAPYQLAALGGDVLTKIQGTVVRSKGDCDQLLGRMRVDSFGRTNLCVSRDQDGQSPYTAISVDLSNLSVHRGSESFRTVGECERFIGL